MKQRCTNPNRPDYQRYGGRGISICFEWEDNYLEFREWALRTGYTDDLSIDRIDVDGNYCPENCRWVPMKIQANNTRRNRYLSFHGESKTISEWADTLGLTYSSMQHRIDRGWSMDRIVTVPMREVMSHATT